MFRIFTSLVIFVIIGTAKGQLADFRCPSLNTQFFRDYTNCSNYITCFNGVAFPQSCPHGLHFDAVNEVCDFPGTVDCSACPSTGIATIRTSCTTYRLCVFGTAIEKECLPGTQFLDDKGECGVGEKECPFIPCEGVNATGVHFHRTRDCRSYHICLDGRNVGLRNCSGDTYFDTVQNTCSGGPLPEGCGAAPPVVDPEQQSQVPSGPPTRAPGNPVRPARASFTGYCPLDGITMMTVPGNCNKYAICVDNQQFEFNCPEGTLFSAEEKLCTLPELAKCL